MLFTSPFMLSVPASMHGADATVPACFSLLPVPADLVDLLGLEMPSYMQNSRVYK